MKIELKKLYDQKAQIVEQMKDVYRDVEKKQEGKATPEQREQFLKWEKDETEIDEQIAFHKRAQKLEDETEARDAVKVDSDANKEKSYNDAASNLERREALAKAKKSGYAALTEEERTIVDTDLRDLKSFEKFLRGGFRNLSKEERSVIKGEKRVGTGQSLTGTEGGYTVPEGFAGRIVEYMAYVSALLDNANIIRTDTGNVIPFPINDDTANTGELIGEASDISTATADLVFDTYSLSAYKFSSKMVKVSAELLQDNGVNLVDYLAKKLAERVARISNTYFTTGSGSSQPQGFLQTRGKVTTSTSTFTAAEMVALQDSIDPAYGNAPGVAWSMRQNILSEIKQLSIASSTDGGVWTPSFRDGAPATILGKPYFLNQAMSSTSATGDKIMAYGDWKKFNIRIVNDFKLRRLDERYAENDQVAFFGLMRADSFLEDTSAVKYMDIS